jgi:hypothetical protein
MADRSAATLALDQSQQADVDAAPASVDIHNPLHQNAKDTDIVKSSNEVELARNQNDRAGEDTTATPVGSAKAQKYEAPAVAAVLQTNELLHLVIGEVPLKHRTSIRRVSKAWQAAVTKIGYTLQPVAQDRTNIPIYSSSQSLVVNDANLMISCFQASGCTADSTVYEFQLMPCRPSGFPKIAELEGEFLTDPPVTQAKLKFAGYLVESTILSVHGGIRIEDVKKYFERIGLGDRGWGKHAYISVQRQEDVESEGTSSSEEEDDPSEPEDESEADDSDESDSGAGGARLPDFGEPGDSDDAGGSSDSDDSSEDGDSNSGEHEQVEDSSAAAVLELPELLHMIICEVPREHRTMLRRVSSNWKAAVEKIGYVFQPDGYGHGYHFEDNPMPLYTSQAIFRSNPVFLDGLFSTGRPADQMSPGYRVEYRTLGSSRSIPHFVSVAKLSENGHQFVTHPPLTELLVRTGSIFDPRFRLQVDGGIRLKDLLDFFQTVRRGGEVALFHGCFRGPKEFFPSKLDEKSGEGSLDESRDAPGGDEPPHSSTPDEPVDESGGDAFDASEGGAAGDEPAESSPPDGGSEKDDVKAGEVEQAGALSTALQINELVHMIISEVPREHRTSIRRVSRNWNAAVTRIGHAFEPSEYEPSRSEKACDLPTYPPQMTFKHNPVFDSKPAWMGISLRNVCLGGRTWCQCLSFYPLRATAQLAKLGNEFITDPPITQARIHSGYIEFDVLLQVRGGIKIRDVLGYFPNLRSLRPTIANVLFGDETRRDKADYVYLSEG